MFNNSNIKNYNLSIRNTVGQEVLGKYIQAGLEHQERITLNNASGVYMVTITDGEDTKTEKIVITKE